MIVGVGATPKWTRVPTVAAGSYWASGTDPAWATLNQAAVAGLTTADSPTLTGLTLSGLTASVPVVTGAGKALASVSYATFKASLAIAQADVSGLTTADGPTLAHLHISDLAAIYTAAESWIGPSSTAGVYFKGGNVGIGTTGPYSKLEVFGANVDPAIFLRTGAANKYTSIRFASTGTTGGGSIGLLGMSAGAGTFVLGDVADDIVLGTQGAQNLILSTNSVSRVYIKSDGSVLIGATALVGSEMLRVVGQIYGDGNISALTFTDRTPHYEGDALKELSAIKGKHGKIDHSTLPKFAQAKNGERDLGAMISMLTVAAQQTEVRLAKLEGS
jgi:hypothetical protein